MSPHLAVGVIPESFGGGRYLVRRELGRGATARVFEVRDMVLGAERAIKRLTVRADASYEERARLVQRFRAEARAMARLAHPNILRIFDLLAEGEDAYLLVMELAEGGSLAQLEAARTPHDRLIQVGADILSALAAVHAAGIVHRDVKPSNILLHNDGRACLSDFGVAWTADSRPVGGVAVGTPGFMPPEQRDGTGRIGPRADIYGLAASLFWRTTGAFPEPTLQNVATGAVWEFVPSNLRSVLARALRAEPEARFASAHEMAYALESAGQERGRQVSSRHPVEPPTMVDEDTWADDEAETAEEQLLRYLDPEQVAELQQLFVDQARMQSDALRDARRAWLVGETGHERIIRIAHTLKGTGATFGFDSVTRASRAVEMAGAATLLDAVQYLLAVLDGIGGDGLPGLDPVGPSFTVQFPAGRRDRFAMRRRAAEACIAARPIRAKTAVAVFRLDPAQVPEDTYRANALHGRFASALESLDGFGGLSYTIEPGVLGVVLDASEVHQVQDVLARGLHALSTSLGAELIGGEPLLFRAGGICSVTPGAGGLLAALDVLIHQLCAGEVNAGLTWITPQHRVVAVVDDDPLIAALVDGFVDFSGVDVFPVVAGLGMIEALAVVRPTVILLDVELPDADGLDLLQAVRAHPTLATTPVLVMTSKAAPMDLAFELGADDYLLKPFSAHELTARVRRMLDRSCVPSRRG